MSEQNGETKETESKEANAFAMEPLSVAIKRFSIFDSDSGEESESDRSSSDAERGGTGSDRDGSNARNQRRTSASDSRSASSEKAHSRSGADGEPPQPQPAALPSPPTRSADEAPVPATPSSSSAEHTCPAVTTREHGEHATNEVTHPLPKAQSPVQVAPQVMPIKPTRQVRRSEPRPSAPASAPTPAPAQSTAPPQPPVLAKSSSKPRSKARAGAIENGGRKTIYERGVLQQRATDQKIEEMRAAMASREVDGATFQPAISTLARRLRRSPDAVLRNHADQEVLRKRLQVLEAPVEEEAAELTFSPRISSRSEKIVRACRAGHQSALPAAERLYLDHVCREQVACEKQQQQQPLSSAAAGGAVVSVRRSRSQIEDHVATLYAFEERKQAAVAAIREAERTGSAQELYVNPAEVVERLTRPRSLAGAEAGALVHVDAAKTAAATPPRGWSGAVEVDKQMSELARTRGLTRWFQYFADGQPALLTHALLDYEGLHVDVAHTIANVLLRANVERSEWTSEQFLAAMEAVTPEHHASQLFFWRTRPITPTAQQRELTFHPQLNLTSERLVAKSTAAAERTGDTHERLFLGARLQQLQRQQAELERQREVLAETEAETQRRQARERQWRRESQEVLSTAAASAAAPEETTPQVDGTARGASSSPEAGHSLVHPSMEEQKNKKGNSSAHTTRAESHQRHHQQPEKRAKRREAASPRATVRVVPSHPLPLSVNSTPSAPMTTTTAASLQSAFDKLQSMLDDDKTADGRLAGEGRSVTPLSIHSEHEEETESHRTNSSIPTGGRSSRHHNVYSTTAHAQRRQSLDFLLACADCRPPTTVSTSERLLLEQENRRRLRRLGMQLYDQQS